MGGKSPSGVGHGRRPADSPWPPSTVIGFPEKNRCGIAAVIVEIDRAFMTIHTLYQSLTANIARARSAEHRLSVQTGLLNALAGLVSLWTLAGILEYIVEFGVAGRTILFWGIVAVGCGILVRTLGGPVGRLLGVLDTDSDDAIARRVGAKISAVGDRLVNVLQLYRTSLAGAGAGSTPGVSMELAEASVVAQGSPLLEYDYRVILEKEDRRRATMLFFSSLLLAGGLFFLLQSDLVAAFNRIVHYQTHYQKPAPFSLTIEPGDLQVVRGDSVEIVVRAAGIPPRSVRLTLAEAESESVDDLELREESPGLYRYVLPNVRGTLDYRAEAAGVMTQDYTITVIERPELREMVVTVTPPRYTGRTAEELPEGYGDVSGLRGTRVAILAHTTMPVARAEIVQLFPKGGGGAVPVAAVSGAEVAPPVAWDTLRTAMAVDGEALRGGFALTRDGEYYLSVTSADGLQNPTPIHYSMAVSTDASPSIVLVQPSTDVDIDESMMMPTQVRIADDYGFSKLRLMYRLTASKYEEPWKEFREQIIPIPQGASAGIDVPYLWNLTKSRLVPEDELEIYFEVYDNDIISGPKVARTGPVKLRFPSFEETLKEAEQVQNNATADLEQLLQKADDARRDMEGLDRELSKQLAQQKTEANWQEKQKLEELIRQHEQMQQKMEQIAEDLRTMAEKLQEARAISPETLQKYQELQKLFDEIKNPELMESMRQIQQEMQQMTPEQMAEAMKNYQFNEEQFRQAVERTKKILERMRTQQKVDELKSRSERLSEAQKELNREMAQAKPSDSDASRELAEQQQELAEQADRLQQEAEKLAQEMKSQSDMPAEQMEGAQQELQQNNPAEQMRQAGQQMQKGKQQGAQQQGQQAQQGVEKFGQQMQDISKQMQQNEQRQVMNKMKKSLQDLLEMSKRQEALRQQTEETQPNSSNFRELAREQAQLGQDVQNLANQLGEIGQKSFAVTPEMGREVGDAMREMKGAQGALEGRNGYSASSQQGEAMSAMNRAAMMMSQQIGQMQNQGGQGQGMGQGMASFRQRLQQMAAQQQMINMAMQQQQQGGGQQGGGSQGEQQGEGEGEGKDGKGGKGGEQNGGKDGMARRLTQQQQDVKKSLEELNKEAREAGGTRKNQVGDLERAAKEIQEVLRDMESGQISEQTLRRQEQILSRMLDAMKSQRERDFEQKRESQPGKDVVRTSPAELTFDNDQDSQSNGKDNLRDGKQGYSRDYEYLIRKYFEQVGGSK